FALLLHGSSPVREARRRPIQRNPRSSHSLGRATSTGNEHTVCFVTFSNRMSGLASGSDQGAKERRTAPTEADWRDGGGKMF
ncbi:hypothetical protein, partial [Microvirga tunisiensis]